MIRSGMTMVELLLALALLSSLTIASVSWTTGATRLLAQQGASVSWQSGAQQVMSQIDNALRTTDRALGFHSRAARVIAKPHGLSLRSRQAILTASGEPSLGQRVAFKRSGSMLVAMFKDATGTVLGVRPLLGHVRSLDIHVAKLGKHERQLTIVITHDNATTIEHTWLLSREDLP